MIIFGLQVKLLMRVHHKNLTTLVGYCYEGTKMGLVYEYMANGDLEAHLSGSVIIEVSSKDPKFLAHQFILRSKENFHLLVTY